MAKQQASRPANRKFVARAQQEAETRRKIVMALGGVGGLILLVLIIGLLRIFVLIPRQPVAIVEGVEISTADYRKRFLYEDFWISQNINQLQTQFQQLQTAFADNAQFRQSLETQTAQQLRQLLAQQSELSTIVFERMVEEALIKQEAARREITVSEAEITAAYEAHIARSEGAVTQPDAEATIVARTDATATSTSATATAELFTPTPTITSTESLTPTEALTQSEVTTATDAIANTQLPVPTPTALEPQPTPTINILSSDSLAQAIQTWEDNLNDATNMTSAELRDIVHLELLQEKLQDAIGAEAESTALHANARHILVETEEEAQAVIERLAAGEAFEDLAAELSTDPGSKDQGGDLGWFQEGDMVPPFSEAAFSQVIGEFGAPVETQFGWHVIEVLAREERELNEAGLLQARREAYNAWLVDAKAGNIQDLRTVDSPPPQFGR